MSVHKSNEFFYKMEQKTRVGIGEGSRVKRSFLLRQENSSILSQQRKGEINNAGKRNGEQYMGLISGGGAGLRPEQGQSTQRRGKRVHEHRCMKADNGDDVSMWSFSPDEFYSPS